MTAPAPLAAAEAVSAESTAAELRADRRVRRRRASLPYLLLAPGIVWLVVFFIVPMWSIISTSVEEGDMDTGFVLTWRWANFGDVWDKWSDEIVRSLEYSLMCTLFCLLLALPLAYFIAFKAGRWKNLLMALVVAPFFTSYLIRTLAWKTILADDGWVMHVLTTLHITPLLSGMGWTYSDNSVLQTPFSVVCGMVYNFLPFTVLPIYTAMEKIDPRLHEAGQDLYASAWATFRKVTFPLALPGIVGGTLLTFIPAVGDYTNAVMLGGPKTKVIGTVIEQQMVGTGGNLPYGAALSVMLMLGTLVITLVYIKKAGTEEIV
ncbi:ABC transporter permease [Catenulispora subtropica]|uniref:ABC transporter permease subunit n=1 Tax=Catenulispora subtropica TaxID=450798 RepID=A0ABP5EC53_9ACTN